MRVAFLLEKFPKLSETFILHQIRQLQRRGVEIAIFAGRPAQEGEVHREAQELLPWVRYYGGEGSRGATLRAVVDGMRSAGGGTLARLVFNERAPRRVAALSRCLAAGIGRYEIVHCHFGPVGQFGAALKAAGGLGGKLITTFHGYDLTRLLRIDPDRYRGLLRQGDLFLPVSERFRQTLIGLGCEPAKVVVHRMGLEVENIPFRPRSWSAEAPARLVSVGRLVEKKGIAYAIGAVARLLPRIPQLHYRIVGDGPERGHLEALVRELRLEGRVELLGWRSGDAVRRVLEESHILVVPSVTAADGDQEGIPVVLMEAMASGMAVVATRHSGIPELVSEGRSGYLVAERDSAGLAARLEALLRGEGAPRDMLVAARREVERNYNLTHLSEQLIAHYRQLLGRA